MGKVGAIVVTFRSSEYLGPCLDSLALAGAEEIVVVENGSEASEKSLVEDVVKQRPKAALVDLAENLGFGAGVNRGFSALSDTQDSTVFIVNPDMLVDRGDLTFLARFLESGVADIVSPVIYTTNRSGPRDWFRDGSYDQRQGATVMRGRRNIASHGKELYFTNFLPGALLGMKASAFRSLGGFREDFFMYWEDAEFCGRAVKRGLKVACVREVEAWHAVGGSAKNPGSKSPEYFYYMQRNRLRMLAEDLGGASLWSVRGPHVPLGLLARALFQKKDVGKKIAANFAGFRDGLSQARVALEMSSGVDQSEKA